jgi:lysophospholipase L1-like esterase
MSSKGRLGPSDRRWNVVGVAAIVASTVALAAAIGIGYTRFDESIAIAPAAPLTPPAAKVIAIVGDSYTAGTPEGGLGKASWAALAIKELLRNGVNLDSQIAATAGSGYVNPGMPAGETLGDDVRQALRKDDDLVVIFGGLNDLEVSPETESKAVEQTLSDLRNRAPTAKVVVIGPAWPNADAPPELLAVRDTLRDNAAQINATFVDPIADRWFVDDPALIGADKVHPTDDGHVYMSEQILPYIQTALAPPTASAG